jgi:signal transduction histidine kinase/CheY-like chemotaxis protein
MTPRDEESLRDEGLEDGTNIREARRRAERELLQAKEALAVKTLELASALQESERRKNVFLAMLAHELRNPLAPVRNAVHILQVKSPPVPEVQWATEVIDRQIHQLTRIVDDLLDLSRITQGKIHLKKRIVDLAAVIEGAVEASRPLIDRAHHALTVTVPDEPVRIEGDFTRLSQVFLNLLDNAAKYTDPGGHIWIDAERRDDHVLVRVRDTGIGIPADMLPNVFDMFTQVERSPDRPQSGLGAGLSLVRTLVEMHGGTVEARSGGLGKGSEFVVSLPVAATRADRPPHRTEALAAPAPSRRILVVDDNRDAASSLCLLLQMLGNDVRTAHDGVEAVEAEEDFRPDVVLLDIGLPRMNGYDAARRIRAARGPDVELVAVTGWGQSDDRRRAKEAGFDIHLTKPVDVRTLQDLLAAHGGRR